jgi:hypothetical protein
MLDFPQPYMRSNMQHREYLESILLIRLTSRWFILKILYLSTHLFYCMSVYFNVQNPSRLAYINVHAICASLDARVWRTSTHSTILVRTLLLDMAA